MATILYVGTAGSDDPTRAGLPLTISPATPVKLCRFVSASPLAPMVAARGVSQPMAAVSHRFAAVNRWN